MSNMFAKMKEKARSEPELCFSVFDGYMGDGRKLATCYYHNVVHDKLAGCPKCVREMAARRGWCPKHDLHHGPECPSCEYDDTARPGAPSVFTKGEVKGAGHTTLGDVVKQYDMKLTNPKDFVGSSKLPLHLWPETATATGCLGLLDGALKYGRLNWRETGVRASIYVDAVRRHLAAWFEGEDLDPDSGLPHMSHALACLAILVDAEAAGKLNDDRQYPGGYRALVERLTGAVEQTKQRHAGKKPTHYTIKGPQ